jgi:EAL domain-containing protein (putative c-di-GMP-specific phosphodiesterase class I)
VEVHFQPVVDLKSGRLQDVEALARVRTPERLLVAGEFIDAVHDLGETAALDRQVLEHVGEQAHKLARATSRLFVNVSPLSLASPAFRSTMAATIARLRDEGLQLVLVLELTEQALLEHLEIVREIHRVHGVTFAVDDFGTGYSSLRTVCDLAVSRVISYLKIDGSLTRQVAESMEAYKVVLAVAHLARSLDLRVIAEHVETAEILERLRTTGIECGQGFLFDPALPAEELMARYEKVERQAELPARPDLAILEPYLHRAFAAFYDVMLSDPHFARHFRDRAQVRGLIERQQQLFVESLGDDEEGLRRRYVELGRRHVQLGIPLATFLKGADLLHEQLLEVLAHTTREPTVPLRTSRFFAALRNHMARGYLEVRLPEARLELQSLRERGGCGSRARRSRPHHALPLRRDHPRGRRGQAGGSPPDRAGGARDLPRHARSRCHCGRDRPSTDPRRRREPGLLSLPPRGRGGLSGSRGAPRPLPSDAGLAGIGRLQSRPSRLLRGIRGPRPRPREWFPSPPPQASRGGPSGGEALLEPCPARCSGVHD